MLQRSSIRRGIAAVTAVAIGSALALIGVAAPAQAAGYHVTGSISVPQVLAEMEPFTVDTSTLSISPAPTSGTYQVFGNGALAYSEPIGYPPAIPTYTLANGWAGMTMHVVLTFDDPEGQVVVTSNTTDPILPAGVRPASLSITGSGIVGTPFTVQTNSSWGSAPTSIDYTWYRVDTNAVVQTGSSDSYTPTADLVGTPVYVAATATRNSLPPASSVSSFSSTVRLDAFANVPPPTVSGPGLLGTDFTASLDTSAVTPTPSAVDYVWYRVDTFAVVQTGGATLAATSALLGTGVYVTATLTAADTTPYTTINSTFSPTVRPNEFANVPAPTVSGTGILGSDFTAALDTSAVTPTPTSVDYVWHRADTDAVVQTGGTTFTPTFALAGTGVYVTATLTASETSTYTTENSAFSATVHLASFTPGDGPVLEGQHTLGGELEAVIDAFGWSPTPESFSFQWFLEDGTPILDARLATLTMTEDLVGEVVCVVATAHATDTQSYAIASAPSGLIAAPTFSLDGITSVVAGSSVTLEGWGLLFDEELEIELQSTPVPLGSFTAGADGTLSATVTVPVLTAAGEHHLVVFRDGVEIGRVALAVTSPPAALTGTGREDAGLGLVALAAALAIGVGVLGVRRRAEAR